MFDFLKRRGMAESPVPRDRDAGDDYWFEPVGHATKSGEVVTVRRARQLPVVRASLKVLQDTVAALGSGVFRRLDNDDRERVRGHPFALLLSDPNPRDTSFDFVANMVDDLAAQGMFLAERVNPYTPVEQLWRILREHYTIEQTADRRRRFRVREPGRPERVLLDEEVWFIAVPPSPDGISGTSAILDDGREAIGAALALQAYAARFFENDATPPFVFKFKGNFAGEEDKANFLNAWARWVGGRRRGKPAVLEHDMDIHQMASTNEAAQFLETRKELWLDISRLWRIQPHKIGILDKATFSNIEEQSLEFITDTLGPWLELIERSVGKTFLEEGEYFEFNVATLLRGDVEKRFGAYATARQWGVMSVNEIRRLENLNGIGPNGDRYMEPLNMTPVGVAPERAQSTEAAIAFLRNSVRA